jgi:hypothetical protein
MIKAFGQGILTAVRLSERVLRDLCAGLASAEKPKRARPAKFEFLELRTFLSAGWDVTLIDSTVADQAVLRRALVPGGRVILYNGKRDSAAQVLNRVTDWAQETGSTIKSLSLLSDGSPGRFEVGNQWISNSNLVQTAPAWQGLSHVLASDAVIELYGCDMSDPLGLGQRLLDRVANITGAQVFATTNLIGRSGDWALEAAAKQLNPFQSSSLVSVPPAAMSENARSSSNKRAMHVALSSDQRASVARAAGGAASTNQTSVPSDEQLSAGAINYPTPRASTIQAPPVGTIAGWTNRSLPVENVVLLDTDLPDAAVLEQAVLPGSNLITYDGATQSADAVLQQVIDWATTHDVRIGSLSILSHGTAGAFELGNQLISTTVLAQTALEWRRLGGVLAEDATVDIFGCDTGAPGSDGQLLIDKIANLTGGAVFASTNLTGKGGDWNLEIGTNGEELPDASAAFPMDAAVLKSYPDSLLLTLSLPAAASPNPVTGKTTSLSVSALDLLGTGTLTYTWSTTGTPPAVVTYSANGTASSNDITATFTKAGTYDFQVSMVDGSDSDTSTVTVTVDQTATSILVSPATAALNENQTKQFAATELDQFGNVMSTQPAFTWSELSGVGSINSSGLYTAPYGTGSASVTATRGSISGSASVTVTNAAPTVATVASASPSPVTGTNTALSVLGADDGGEPNLTYTWATTGTPPASVTFSANGTNAAKNTIATLTKAGSYTFRVTITDAGGLSTTSSVNVTVDQTLKSITVSPASAPLDENQTQQFTAVGSDQFGRVMVNEPAFTWAIASGAGSINANGLYTAPDGTGSASVTATSGATSGSAAVTVTNAPPTVATAAAANPNPVTGATTALSALGADDGGESNLIYTWATTSTPPAAVAFSANGTNAAKSTTATFTQAGTYDFTVRITDAGGLSATSAVSVRVDQTEKSITVTPGSPSLSENQTQQFAATALDQFGNAMSPQPAISWSMTGSGTLGGTGLYSAPATAGTAAIIATAGQISSGTIVTTIAPDQPPVNTVPASVTTPENTPITFSAGNGNAISVSDPDADGGIEEVTLTSSNGTLTLGNTSGITIVSGSASGGGGVAFTGTIPNLNAALNGLVFTPATNNVGSATLQIVTDDVGNTGSGGPLSATSSIPITIESAYLSVATPASASPSPVAGTTTALTVLGADSSGESTVAYTWATTGTPPAAVAFSANGTNAAKNTTATFTSAGTYDFRVTMTDTGGLSATSSVSVTVDQTLKTIAVTPTTTWLVENQTNQLAAVGQDQFGNAMATQPSVTWDVGSGVGMVSSGGLYTAPGSTGSATVTASSGAVAGSATITVSNAAPTVATAASASPNTVTGTSTSLSVLGADDGGEANLTYSWSILSVPSSAQDPSFSLNGSNAAKDTTATFSHDGTYVLEATITDAGGLSVNSTVSVTVDQTFTGIVVSPANLSLAAGSAQQYAATALDQFGMGMTQQPAFAWATSDGIIGLTGLFTAPPTSGSVTVSATNGSVSGSTTATIVGSNIAEASPSTVTGSSTTLSVSGGATSGVTYTWSTLTEPSGAASPTFTNNASASAQTTNATFYAAGNYEFQVAINAGATTTQTVEVTVEQTLSSIVVSPGTSDLNENGKQAFSSSGFDQFDQAMLTQPSFVWSVASGEGTIDGNGLYTAAGSDGAGPATVSASSGSIVGSAGVSVTDAAPTVALLAAASPSSINGASTSLSVLGADDGGESNLTYTWSTVGNSPAAVVFAINGSNAAKDTSAIFTQAGDYHFLVTINDAEGLSVTSTTEVTVNQTLTTLSLSPASPTVTEGSSQQLTATAKDQFGNVMTTPSLMWSIESGSGSIDTSGLYIAASSPGTTIVAASSGGASAAATITVSNEPPTVATGAAASPGTVTGTSTALSVLGADDGGDSNLIYTWTTTGTPAAAVTFSANDSNAAKDTTATFTKAGAYQFLVTITDAQGLSSTSSTNVIVDQTLTGLTLSPASANVAENADEQFSATATDQFGNPMSTPALLWSVRSGTGFIGSSGLYTAAATPGLTTIAASIGSASATATVTVPNQPPTVAIAAAASPRLVAGTSTTLSVLGADDGGEANLTYTWSTIGAPPAPVEYSSNGTNDAKNTVATFSAAGDYSFLVTITDAYGATATSSVNVLVVPTAASVKVTPASSSLGRGQTIPFSAVAYDQFGAWLASQPTFTWSTAGNVGSIDPAGLYIAPIAGNGTVTILATAGSLRGIASINLVDELSATAPPTMTALAGSVAIFAGADAVTVIDGDPTTASVPVSITLSATAGTISLSGTSGLTFLEGTENSSGLATFSGSIAEVNNALQGMAFTPDAGFAGNGSVIVTVNEVGTGKPSPTYSVAILPASPPIPRSNGTPVTPSNGGSSLSSILDTSSTADSSATTSGGSSTTSTDTTSSGEAVIAASTSTPTGTVTPVPPAPAPTPAKPADNTPKAQPQSNQPANQPTNAPETSAAEGTGTPPSQATAVPDVRVESLPEQVFPFLAPKSEMSKEMDAADENIVHEHKLKVVAGTASVASVGASAAYVLWLLRGGSLLSSLLSMLPAWQSIDPLPVLDNFESRKRRKKRMNADSDGESIESMVDKANSDADQADEDQAGPSQRDAALQDVKANQ